MPNRIHSTTRPLFGQVALITGAGRGIGAAIALELAKAGAAVAINYLHSADGARAVAAECHNCGSRAIAIQADVTSGEEVTSLVAETTRALGTPSILVNNAGIAHTQLILDTSEQTWDEVMNVNLKAPFLCSRAVMPGMIAAKYGRIVNISSIWGLTGGSCEAAYSAAKGGVLAYTKALAKELGPSGITVNAVAPGVTNTDMLNTLSSEDLNRICMETPVGRLGVPADIAAAVLFLTTPQASFITGQVLSPNGGLVT